MPFGLTRNTWPFEASCPAIVDGVLGHPIEQGRSGARLHDIDDTPRADENVFQLTIALLLFCVIVIAPGVVAIPTVPLATEAPVGNS